MLRIAGHVLNPRLIVLDKDGTLIAFEAMWHSWFERLMEALTSQIPLDAETQQGLAATLGYDPQSGKWDPLGPLTIAATGEVALLIASQLYRYQGKTWEEALAIVARAEEIARATLPVEELTEPIGDVRGALERLKAHGLLLALVTTDVRATTERTLAYLGLSPLFDVILCGDDGLPLKPAPDMALDVCRRLGVAPQEAIMIGDTSADLIMARRAGYRCAIGVTSGALSREALAPYADLIIPDIHAIELLPDKEERASTPSGPSSTMPAVRSPMSHSRSGEPRYDGYIFDLDGTIYLGEHLIPGAKEVVAWLRGHGRRAVFLSNKPLEPGSSYAAKLTRLGIPATPDEVITSVQALIYYLREHHPRARLFVIGEKALLDELRREGFTLTEAVEEIDVVVAAFDRTLDYAKLNTAHQALVRGARFLATNADRTCPIEGGALPDCAGVIAFLEATSERKVELIAGKPSANMLEAAVARLGVPKERCLLVGDRLATDMVMGQQAGMDTALVLTGVTTREMLAQSDLKPTYVLESVADVP